MLPKYLGSVSGGEACLGLTAVHFSGGLVLGRGEDKKSE